MVRLALVAAVLVGCLAGIGAAAAENVTSAASAGDAPPAEAESARLPGTTTPAVAAGVIVGVFVTVGVFTYRDLE